MRSRVSILGVQIGVLKPIRGGYARVLDTSVSVVPSTRSSRSIHHADLVSSGRRYGCASAHLEYRATYRRAPIASTTRVDWCATYSPAWPTESAAG